MFHPFHASFKVAVTKQLVTKQFAKTELRGDKKLVETVETVKTETIYFVMKYLVPPGSNVISGPYIA